jgi:hypothetical protein
VDRLKALVSKLQQQATLADGCITNNDVLEEVGVTHTWSENGTGKVRNVR